MLTQAGRLPIDALKYPASDDLWMGGHLVQLQHRFAARVAVSELLLPLGSSPRCEQLLECPVPPLALLSFRKLLIDELGTADRIAQGGPELRL